jgi:hypothetical protein
MSAKILIIYGLIYISAHAGTNLIQIDLGPQRLIPLASEHIEVIAELEHSALAIVEDNTLPYLSPFSYQILSQDAEEGDLYLVRSHDNSLDLSLYGTIVFTEDRDHLISVDPDMFEQLIGQPVHVKKLFFRPIQITSHTEYHPVTRDPTIQDIVDLVDPDTILAIVQRLQDFKSRYSTYDSCFAAGNWIQNKFTSYGVDSVFFQYHTGGHAPNVVAVKRGVLYPDSIYTVICGHYDAITYYGQHIAPGADDNASGTAAVIEAARVTKDYQFEYSIRYIAFSGEEFGLYGSEYYAYHAYVDGDSIRGVFNGDMIGYVNAQPESVEVIGKTSNPSCDWLADFFIAAADTYTTVLTRKRLTNNWIPSDNQSFLDYGYPALLEIEDSPVTNPHYHDPSDTIGAGYNNNDFCTEVAKAEIAAISIMAVPYVTGIKEEISTITPFVLSVMPTMGSTHFTITAGPSAKSDILITIHDISGRQVARYANSHTVVWHGTKSDGTVVPAGVYIVRACSAGHIAQEKLILVR